jgi:hypothetical protein
MLEAPYNVTRGSAKLQRKKAIDSKQRQVTRPIARPEAIMLLILPIILFCISHYTSPIILSFLPIILKLFSTENSENTYISGTQVHACAYYTNLRIFIAKLLLQIFTARVGLRFAVTVVDARLSPLDGELGVDIIYKLQAAQRFHVNFSAYSPIIPALFRFSNAPIIPFFMPA